MFLGQLHTDRSRDAFQRQLRRLQVLLGTQHDHGFRIELDGSAVRTLIQDLRAERGSDHGTVGCNTLTAFTAERLGRVDVQFQVLCRLRQVRRFE
ncbi:hypothetical protein D9M71_390510 [compost metagenome]